MSVKKQNIQNYFLYETHVENIFISEYMPSAPENAVKVYLLALMHAEQGLPLSDAALAKKLGISADAVAEAWSYWQKCGAVRRLQRSAERPGEYDIEFINIKESAFGRRSDASVSTAEAAPFALDDAVFSKLIRDVEAETKRLLESREPEEIASWISEYGMEPELILLGYRYCTQRGKSNRCRYVGAVLKDWMAKGLTTAALAQDSLDADDRHYKFYRAVMKELGFNRSASEPEKRIMDKWFDEFGCSLDEVKDAIRKTTGISNPNINYVNTILTARNEEKNRSSEPVTQENIFAKVTALYESIRAANEEKSAQIRSEIFTKVPRIRSIVDELKECSVDISKAMLRGGAGSAELEKHRKRSAKLSSEKAALLEKNGYPANALDPIFDCRDCRDTGVLDDGSRCHCFNEKAEKLLKNNG